MSKSVISVAESTKSDYIRVKASYTKMKTAESMEQTLFIYGVTGYGKTEMVKHFLRRKKYALYSCKNGYLAEDKNKNDKSSNLYVIDDLQFLKSEEEREKVKELLRSQDYWVILLSRSAIPPWLKASFMENPFIIIGEKDLTWTKEDIHKYLWSHELEITDKEEEEILASSKGNPMFIRLCVNICDLKGQYDDTILTQTWKDVEDYLEHSVVGEWKPELVQFLMYMSFLEDFTILQAETITNNKESYSMIAEAMEIGNFITIPSKGHYALRPILRNCLQTKARREWDSERCREVYYNIGKYYELNGQPHKALEMYEKSGNHGRIMDLLIHNARKNPGSGHYFELRNYYLSLTEEEIRKDVVLMSGMSMLYSLLLEPDKSEYWYEQLKKQEQHLNGGAKREARSRIAYLDIALPHRGVTGILEIMKALPALWLDHGVALPEFSVTSNLPSLMNGGKDFSQWSKKDREIASSMGKVVSLILGKYGKGLVGIALAESLYEKGGDTYEILSLLSKGSLEAGAGGKFEMEFAAAGTQVRLNLFHGNEDAAVDILEAFQKKAEENQAEEILKTIQAIKCRIALYQSDKEVVQMWFKQAPDEHQEFFIMERYRYMTKVRCYIYLEDYLSALYLLEQMDYYAKEYQRTLYQIETFLLKAVVFYRMKKKEWMEAFLQATELAKEYGFYRGISEEGAALTELWKDPELQKQIPKKDAFYERLQLESMQMALHFPTYLHEGTAAPPDISKKALDILKLQAEGCSYSEIGQKLNIKEATVKYHCGETYKKLGVTGKADAIMAARNLKLI